MFIFENKKKDWLSWLFGCRCWRVLHIQDAVEFAIEYRLQCDGIFFLCCRFGWFHARSASTDTTHWHLGFHRGQFLHRLLAGSKVHSNCERRDWSFLDRFALWHARSPHGAGCRVIRWPRCLVFLRWNDNFQPNPASRFAVVRIGARDLARWFDSLHDGRIVFDLATHRDGIVMNVICFVF